DPLGALVLPPVEALEDAWLLARFARPVLVDEEGAVMQLPLCGERSARGLRSCERIGRERFDALAAKVADDLPVPHRHRPELGRQDEDRQGQSSDLAHTVI